MIPEESIFFKISRVAQKANRFWSTMIQDMSLTPVQGLVLLFLHDQDQVTFSELSRRSGLDSATLTGIIDRLERSNLIMRMQKPGDRRAFLICLTVEGGKTAETVNDIADLANRDFLSFLPKTERNSFIQMLDKIRE